MLVTGLVQARAGLRTWLALLAAPWYVAWKAVVQVRALASVLRRDDVLRPDGPGVTPGPPARASGQLPFVLHGCDRTVLVTW